MEPLFSEFSYGYALTQEFASGRFGNLIGPPFFPPFIRRANRAVDTMLSYLWKALRCFYSLN